MFSLSDTLSAVAVVVSGLALLQASQTQQENKKLQHENLVLQKRMLHIEEARENDRLIEGKTAKLIARIGRGTIPGEPSRLVIQNKGQSEARDIKIVINGKPIASCTEIDYQPTSTIPSEESVDFYINSTYDSPDQFHVKMTWIDDSGEPGLSQVTLRA